MCISLFPAVVWCTGMIIWETSTELCEIDQSPRFTRSLKKKIFFFAPLFLLLFLHHCFSSFGSRTHHWDNISHTSNNFKYFYYHQCRGMLFTQLQHFIIDVLLVFNMMLAALMYRFLLSSNWCLGKVHSAATGGVPQVPGLLLSLAIWCFFLKKRSPRNQGCFTFCLETTALEKKLEMWRPKPLQDKQKKISVLLFKAYHFPSSSPNSWLKASE